MNSGCNIKIYQKTTIKKYKPSSTLYVVLFKSESLKSRWKAQRQCWVSVKVINILLWFLKYQPNIMIKTTDDFICSAALLRTMNHNLYVSYAWVSNRCFKHLSVSGKDVVKLPEKSKQETNIISRETSSADCHFLAYRHPFKKIKSFAFYCALVPIKHLHIREIL